METWKESKEKWKSGVYNNGKEFNVCHKLTFSIILIPLTLQSDSLNLLYFKSNYLMSLNLKIDISKVYEILQSFGNL